MNIDGVFSRYKLKITQIISTPPNRRASINTNKIGFGLDLAEAYLDVQGKIYLIPLTFY